MRRIAALLTVAALALGACGGDSDDAGVTVDEPIGAPEPHVTLEPDVALEPPPSVAKSARVEMEVARSEVSAAAQAVVDLATSPKIDGYLSSSVVDLEHDYGSAVILVHVPVGRFEQAMADLGGIGEVTRQEMAGRQLADPATGTLARKAVAAEAALSPIDVAIAGRPPAPPREQSAIEQSLDAAAVIALAIASGVIVAAGAVVPGAFVLLTIWLLWSAAARRLRPRWASRAGG